MTQLSSSGIQAILPHRYPFLFVDRVTELVPGKRIVGVKNASAGDSASQGCFPAAPILPGAILIEMVTQLGAILVLERPQMAGKVPVIVQIPSARQLRPVRADEALRLEAEVVKLRETFGELRGAVYAENELVAEGTLRFAMVSVAEVMTR